MYDSMKPIPHRLFRRCRRIAGLLALPALGLLVACDGPADKEAENPANLVVALEPDKNPDAMLADQRALQQYLTNETGMESEIIVPLTSTVITEGLKNGTIDFAYLSATATARLMRTADIEILLATEIDGQPFYQSYWLARQDAPYDSVADLRGQPIAFASRTSTSGFIVPVYDLFQSGHLKPGDSPEDYFGEGNVAFGVGYVSAVNRVLDGSAEAAAVSYYVFEEDKHLTAEQRARLKVVDDQGPVPTHVIVVRANLAQEVKQRAREAFTALNQGNTDLRDRLFGAPLIEVDPEAHIAPIREALQLVEQMRL